MKYISTRGNVCPATFSDAVLSGLADDGGLFVPETWPEISQSEIDSWKDLSYEDLCFAIFSLFISESEIPKNDLKTLIAKSYSTFKSPSVVTLVPLKGHGEQPFYMLELFHGPTFAFKDVALQFLGNLLEYLLDKRKKKATVLAATSGDTGSAALYGIRSKNNVTAVVLYPEGRVSDIQERQMTTLTDDNIHNIAVKGTFDDCQSIVKELFCDLDFKTKHSLAAVNSINFARILAQMVYYFKAYFEVRKLHSDKDVVFSVPTGNFGNVLAGWYAKRLGLPVCKFIVATNRNDILHKFFTTGSYSRQNIVHATHSPAMDIQIASNFERFLFELERDAMHITAFMKEFIETATITLGGSQLHRQAQSDMFSYAVSDLETLDEIRNTYAADCYLLCPHTAVGVRSAREYLKQVKAPNSHVLVSLATAHPAKFSQSIEKAIGMRCCLPNELDRLKWMKVHSYSAEASAAAIKRMISSLGLKPANSFCVRVPASCANLGSGYDVFGLAVQLYLEVHVRESSLLLISFKGEGEKDVAKDESNLIWKSAQYLARHCNRVLPKLALSIRNDIPFSRGLGSSSCAVVAGLLIANRVCDLQLTSSQLLTFATRLEGHPDNAAACIFGGFVSSSVIMDEEGTVADTIVAHHSVALPIKCVVAIPDAAIATADARSVIPTSFSRADVVFNLQRVSALTSGMATASRKLIEFGIEDVLHQPYRAKLMPWLTNCLALSHQFKGGLLGICLSGAGSSVLALATDLHEQIGESLVKNVEACGISCRYVVLSVDRTGAQVSEL